MTATRELTALEREMTEVLLAVWQAHDLDSLPTTRIRDVLLKAGVRLIGWSE